MERYKQEFIEFMIDCQVLKFGDFVTKSGRKTPFFVNTGFYRTGAQLRKLGEYYAQAIKNTFGLEFDVLFGPAYKGIPLSVAATIAISEKYDADMLDAAPNLKVIIRFGVGLDNYDVAEMKKRGIQIGVISNNNAVADDTGFARIQNAGRNQTQFEFFVTYNNSMASVVTTLVPYDCGSLFC